MSTDVFSPEQRSAVMRRVKGRDTSPELAVRRILRAAGIGYRLGGQGLAGRPDVTMKGRKVAVFVHGCFWHGHDCARGARKPKANAEYWSAGWRVLTVWECDLRTPGFAERLVADVRDQAAAISAA